MASQVDNILHLLIVILQTFQANQIVKKNIQFSLEISAVIHSLQIERGTTALYVSSGGDPFVKPRLVKLYVNTDAAISSLSNWISMSTPDYFQSRASFHQTIIDFRADLNPKNISLKEVIGFYTDHNAIFIRMIAQSLNLKKPFYFWTDLTSYQMLIFSKEQAGIERALGSTYFARGKYTILAHARLFNRWRQLQRQIVTCTHAQQIQALPRLEAYQNF